MTDQISVLYNGIERPEHTPDMIEELREDEVFVFGSNLAGMHGGGAAYVAFKKFGAVMGEGTNTHFIPIHKLACYPCISTTYKSVVENGIPLLIFHSSLWDTNILCIPY